MVDKQCSLCKHYLSIEPKLYGQCRRSTPVIIAEDKYGHWPYVANTSWCSKFKYICGDKKCV